MTSCHNLSIGRSRASVHTSANGFSVFVRTLYLFLIDHIARDGHFEDNDLTDERTPSVSLQEWILDACSARVDCCSTQSHVP